MKVHYTQVWVHSDYRDFESCQISNLLHGATQPATADEKQLEVAKQYVDTQLATMKKYGSAPPKMSTQEYRALVQEVVDTLQSK